MKTSISYRPVLVLISICLSTWIFLACTNRAELPETKMPVKNLLEDSIGSREKELVTEKPKPIISYHLDSIADKAALDSFHTRYSAEEKKVIFTLNRIDSWRLKTGDLLVIPDSLTTDFLTYSPFPEEMNILLAIPRTVLISQRVQAFGLYESGKLLRWGPVSSGKQSTPTPNGLHYGNYKAKRKISTVNKDWILPYYFNFMNFEGVGVHQYSMPGYPASHACVRLFEEDAAFIYNWAEQWKLNQNGQIILENGTPFMVFGEYDYESKVPWQKLAEDPNNNFLNDQEKDTLKSYVARYVQDGRNFPVKAKKVL